MDPDTSVHTLSISELSRSSAKAWSAASGSLRNPTSPAADVKPTIFDRVFRPDVSRMDAMRGDGASMMDREMIADEAVRDS